MEHVDIDKAAEIAVSAKKIMLTCHRGPDGDSVGSMSALATMFRDMGKSVTLYSPDLVPRYLKWLPRTKSFIQGLKKSASFDLTIVVDCGDKKLLGKNFPDSSVTGKLLVIDHHASAVPFGDYYCCDASASSVGVLVARMAKTLGWELNKDAGLAIYLSMVADTGSFRYSNTNAEALELAAKIVGMGINPWTINERLGERGSLTRYKLLSKVLNDISLFADDACALMIVTDKMVKESKATWEDTEGFVNYARAIDGVDCGVLLSPAKQGGVRVSMRSKGKIVDAGQVCKTFGGGGHTGAAGCRLDGELEDAQKTIVNKLTEVIEQSKAEQKAQP